VPHKYAANGIYRNNTAAPAEERKLSQHAAWDAEAALGIIRTEKDAPGALLPILHALQEQFGYIDRDAEPLIADVLNLSRAEVHGVVTFYNDFREKPAGRHVLKLCRAESCQARGSETLAAQAEARLGVAFGNTTADGRVTLEPVYCLGLCSVSPSAMVDGRVVARLDEKKLDALLAEVDR
jgi:formate dehydrogenase subunit gamma